MRLRDSSIATAIDANSVNKQFPPVMSPFESSLEELKGKGRAIDWGASFTILGAATICAPAPLFVVSVLFFLRPFATFLFTVLSLLLLDPLLFCLTVLR